MSARKVADGTPPYARTWTLDEGTLSVEFAAAGPRYAMSASVVQGTRFVGGEESTFRFTIPLAGDPRTPDDPGAFAWAAEQVTAWCALNKWDGRCVARSVGDVELLMLEAP